ncbi:hypothetical protein C8Q76DRAFT_423001 [Earliella scabrosa]|nr:hypothetical protein C8Q76DRAFT_423001 [Earliella scabrosa]
MSQTFYTLEAQGASSEFHRHPSTRAADLSWHSLQALGPLSIFQGTYYVEYFLSQLITSPHSSDCVIIPIRNALPSSNVEESTPATYISVDWSRLLVFESTPHIVHVPLQLILSSPIGRNNTPLSTVPNPLQTQANLNGRSTTDVDQGTERTKIACTRCRQAGKKCSNNKPCDRCVQRGHGDTCANAQSQSRALLRGPSPPVPVIGPTRLYHASNGSEVVQPNSQFPAAQPTHASMTVENTTRQAQQTLEYPPASFYEPHSNAGNSPLNTFSVPTGPTPYTPYGHGFGQYTGTGEVFNRPANLPIWSDHAAGSVDVRGQEVLFDAGVATTNEYGSSHNLDGF